MSPRLTFDGSGRILARAYDDGRFHRQNDSAAAGVVAGEASGHAEEPLHSAAYIEPPETALVFWAGFV
jgi:hypothetical protein